MNTDHTPQEATESGKSQSRIARLEAALSLALHILEAQEPPDSRAVSDEFVAMAAVLADSESAECMEIIAAGMEVPRSRESTGPELVIEALPETKATVTQPAPWAHPCPKCGSRDIHRKFWKKGETWRRHDGSTRVWQNEFVTVEQWEGKAKKDCITHHCRSCQWNWATPPLSIEQRTAAPKAEEDYRAPACTPGSMLRCYWAYLEYFPWEETAFPIYDCWICSDDEKVRAFRQGWAARCRTAQT